MKLIWSIIIIRTHNKFTIKYMKIILTIIMKINGMRITIMISIIQVLIPSHLPNNIHTIIIITIKNIKCKTKILKVKDCKRSKIK